MINDPFSSEPKYGRRQILYKMWDADKYPFMRTTKSSFLTYMTLAREPKTQIAGITLLGDMEEMTRRHAPGNWTEVKMYASFLRVRSRNSTIQSILIHL